MKILALDAGLGPFSAALDVDGRSTADRGRGSDALETGLGRIAALLGAAGLRVADLDRIAVGVGPGSFTGIRIAIALAKSLAYASHVALVGVSSYDILTPPDFTGASLAVVAGRSGIVCARLSASSAASIACGPTASVFERLLEAWPPELALPLFSNVEDGVPAIGEARSYLQRVASPASANPAVALARLAHYHEAAPNVHGVEPDYGEMPAVTVPKARPSDAPAGRSMEADSKTNPPVQGTRAMHHPGANPSVTPPRRAGH